MGEWETPGRLSLGGAIPALATSAAPDHLDRPPGAIIVNRMQQLTPETDAAALQRCAADVLEAALLVSRYVRAQMWHARPAELTLPQFRALAMVAADASYGPSQLAEALLLSRPAVSRLLDELARKGLLERETDPEDRRRLVLTPTAAGRACVEQYFTAARALVTARLAVLSAAAREEVAAAMEHILPCFSRASPSSSSSSSPSPAAS